MRQPTVLPVVLVVASLIAAAAPNATAPAAPPAAEPTALVGPPPARTVDIVDSRFGISAPDPYRWMEGNDNAELATWLHAQGERTAGWLARVPGRGALLQRIRQLGLGTSSSFDVQLAGGRTFYRHIGAGEQLPKLMVRDAAGSERVLVDPEKLGDGGSHASVNAYAPSPDGTLVAYDLALGGGEVSSVHVIDVTSGKQLPDAVDRVWGEFSANWLPDGKGFLYTQMAPTAAGQDPMLGMRVRLHVLGRPVSSDAAVLGSGVGTMPFSPEEHPVVFVDPSTKWMVARAGGAHSEIRVGIARLSSLDRTGAGKTPWQHVADYGDSIERLYPHGDRLYLQTFKEASNRKLISVPLAHPDLAQARVELAESPEATLVNFAVARDAIYAETMVSGRARLWRLPWNEQPAAIPPPFDGWTYELAADPLRDGVAVDVEGWTQPDTYYAYDVTRGKLAPTGMATTTNADYSGIAADEVEATSADGTKVPLSVLRSKNLQRDGSHPAILSGYGGYGISLPPSFSPTRLAWLERGGVFAVCHVRGGGEKGHAWQASGTHEQKMNGVHDFEACGQYLIDQRFTSAAHLAGQVGSMGGILIGRAITERPDLFAAANAAVGFMNPLRMLAAENGANQKIEIGDPDTEAGFRSIYVMDPYQHVKPGTAYPAVIFTVGLNDRRVAPWMTAKMAAAMQAATTSGKPIVVRVEGDAGHGIGSTRDQEFAERADVYSFFLAASGDPAFQSR
jgi:prolyl oligopeptidase